MGAELLVIEADEACSTLTWLFQRSCCIHREEYPLDASPHEEKRLYTVSFLILIGIQSDTPSAFGEGIHSQSPQI